MNCPACTRPLTALFVEDIEVDACHGGCGGLWFDNFELAKFDEPHEPVDDTLLIVPLDPAVHPDTEAKRNCPKCAVPMMRHYFSQQRRTHMDSCPQCGGNWLDAGELAQVRLELREKANRATAKGRLNKRLQWFTASA